MTNIVYVVGILKNGEYWFNLTPGGNYGYATQEDADSYKNRIFGLKSENILI